RLRRLFWRAQLALAGVGDFFSPETAFLAGSEGFWLLFAAETAFLAGSDCFGGGWGLFFFRDCLLGRLGGHLVTFSG
ncbi:hypothetical protein, partial [Paenibacillus alba]